MKELKKQNLNWVADYAIWTALDYMIEYSFKSNLYECFFRDELLDKKETLEMAKIVCENHLENIQEM